MIDTKHLVACPACESPLIQIDSCRPVSDQDAFVERHCPECGAEDMFTVSMAVADLLDEYTAELGAGLALLADRLDAAHELWLYG